MSKFKDFLNEQNNAIMDLMLEDVEETLSEKTHALAQPWGHFHHKPHENAHDKAKEFYHKHVMPHVQHTERDFHKLLHRSKSHNAKVVTATKPEKSFVDKVVDRKKPAEHVHDVRRGAILTRSHEETKKVVQNLKKHGHVTDYEYKHPKGSGDSGYHGVHHLSVNIGGVHHEVQVTTKRNWAAKKHAHDIYAKHRTVKQDNYKQDAAHSRHLFHWANRGAKHD